MRKIRSATGILRRAAGRAMGDNTPMLAAGLAFYTVLSLAPALLVIVAVAGMWFGRASAEAELIAKVQAMFGPMASEMTENVLRQAGSHTSAATVAGLASMFFGATMAFSALRDCLNHVWKVSPRQRGVIRGFVLTKAISFVVVLLIGVVLLGSLVLAAGLAAVSRFLPSWLPAPSLMLQAAEAAVSLLLLTVLFAVLFRVLPEASAEERPPRGDVWKGAAVTALLFTAGKTLIALYLAHTTTGSAYGAAGSLVVFLLWVYYSAQIVLFGAVLTQEYSRRSRART